MKLGPQDISASQSSTAECSFQGDWIKCVFLFCGVNKRFVGTLLMETLAGLLISKEAGLTWRLYVLALLMSGGGE